ERLVELERARLNRERTRRGAGLGRFVDDANADAQPREPQGEDEPRRPRSDDEDRALARQGNRITSCSGGLSRPPRTVSSRPCSSSASTSGGRSPTSPRSTRAPDAWW